MANAVTLDWQVMIDFIFKIVKFSCSFYDIITIINITIGIFTKDVHFQVKCIIFNLFYT